MAELAGLDNCMTDVIVDISFAELKRFGLKRGLSNGHVTNFDEIIRAISTREQYVVEGGSATNVVQNATALGIKSAFLGTVGNDDFGRNYINAVEKNNIETIISVEDGHSPVCYILVTPDHEKTSIERIGVGARHTYDYSKIKEAKVFHTTGYALDANPERVVAAAEYFSNLGSRISFDLSSPRAIKNNQKAVGLILDMTHILFMTEEEADALTGLEPVKALEEMCRQCSIVVLKKGERGSVVRKNSKGGCEQYEIPIVKVKVVNTNGAGDAYQSGFLTAYLRGKSLEQCGHYGSEIASRVVGIKDSHL